MTRAWDQVMEELERTLAQREVHPARTVVLLPYAQLIGVARAAWTRRIGACSAQPYFMPRFETTMNWSRSLAGFVADSDDLRLDAARDLPTASVLLDRAGLAQHRTTLNAPLMEAAWSVAALAGAVPPEQRSAWGAQTSTAMFAQGAAPALELESRLAHVALAWAANSGYPGDAIFSAQADLLVLLEGLQRDPLHGALQQRWGARALVLRLPPAPGAGQLSLHRALDPEDEAERAAACVLAHLGCQRAPVALVAQDRVLTRRTRALLAERGVSVRDETGWTLSTTRSAAAVVGLLRAMAWDASTDAVLDWIKNAPAVPALAVEQFEVALRRAAMRDWRRWRSDDPVTQRVDAARDAMKSSRPLAQWLSDLRSQLQGSGQWAVLLQDTAGQAVIDALHLHEHAGADFSDLTQSIAAGAFATWVGQVLEAGSFVPPHPPQAQVVILPLSQLLGRAMAAVVLPGCDEAHLSASPDPAGVWTPAQRELLGLPSRDELARAAQASWRCAMGAPFVDILWRVSEGGELVMPGIFVQQLRQFQPQLAPDPRSLRRVTARPCTMPRPGAGALVVKRLTASAYEDLRRCPYRYFALRQLGLRESDELDSELEKRDFGNWVHVLLRHFHESMASAPVSDLPARIDRMDLAAAQATRELALAPDEFLPFAASWPQLRSAYLAWLREHEAGGAGFHSAEVAREMPMGGLTLVGRIDRIDRLRDGGALVIDYKTESRTTTAERIKRPNEDTQLAFYAALLEDDTLSAMYLHIAESDPTRAYDLPDVVAWRDRLVTAIRDDMQRIAGGAALPALGAGSACDYCAARGLCRKDYWSGSEPAIGVAHG